MLNEKLDEYLKNEYYPFHMPGAKRTDILRNDLPYQRDLTEIEGFDNLNDPRDILLELENKIADIYSVNKAIISTNGSTCGILSTIRALTYKNKNILIERTSHKAVYNAIEINNLNPSYIDVELSEENAVVGINYQTLSKKLNENKFAAVVITSPSYEGYILDLEKIYKECKKANTPLVVDLAHGSHLILNESWSDNFDIAITSFHKNLSGLTPSACVLINNETYINEIKRNMAIFQSSSPSYILMQSIDEMVEKFDKFYDLYKELDKNLDEIYNLKLNHLQIIDKANKDRSKILISTNSSNINGAELQELLKIEKIEIEMAYPSYALLISTIFDKKYAFDRLKNALIKIDEKISFGTNKQIFRYDIPQKKYNIAEVFSKNKIKINIDQAIDKISADFVYAYPPGIPLIVPGEVIDKQVIKNIQSIQKKGIELNIDKYISIINWHFFAKLLL